VRPFQAHIPGNLAKYMFNKVCSSKGVDRFEEFLHLLGLFFNAAVNEEVPEEDLEEIE
jgi:hypothetical protein